MIGQVKNGNIVAQKAKNTNKSMTKWQLVGVGINEIRLPIKSFAVKIKKPPELKKMRKLQYQLESKQKHGKFFAKQSPYTVPLHM